MIAKLKGKVINIFPNYIIIDVVGVGYKVEISLLDNFLNTDIDLFIHTYVRENELRLFGFKSSKELFLFEKLLGVSGVGPKASLSLITTLGYDRLVKSIIEADAGQIKVPGVGRKTAERIIIDLRSMIEKATQLSDLKTKIDSVTGAEDVVLALIQLGYAKEEIEYTLKQIDFSKANNLNEMIKLALNHLHNKNG